MKRLEHSQLTCGVRNEPRPSGSGLFVITKRYDCVGNALALLVLSVSLGCWGCESNEDGWAGLKAKIRRDFPSVKQVSIEQFESSYQGHCLLVDVREPEEFAVSHIQGAVNITDPAVLAARIKATGERRVVVYCSVGYRSSRMAKQLHDRGVTGVWNLEGSIFEWGNSGRPVVNESGPAEVIHLYEAQWGKFLLPKLRGG